MRPRGNDRDYIERLNSSNFWKRVFSENRPGQRDNGNDTFSGPFVTIQIKRSTNIRTSIAKIHLFRTLWMSIIRFPYRNRNGDIGISKTVYRQLCISRGQFFSMPRRDKIRMHVVPINKDSLASLVEKTFQKRRSSSRFPKRPSDFHDNRPPVVKILDSRNCFVIIPSTPLSPPKKINPWLLAERTNSIILVDVGTTRGKFRRIVL